MEHLPHDNTLLIRSQVISYLSLRRIIGILGILLPVVLVVGSVVACGCTELQHSISAYYHTGMRNLFVGILSGVALFLFSYKGYTRLDDVMADMAALFALGVAFFPTSVTGMATSCIIPINTNLSGDLHYVSAALFFCVLAFFSLVLFTRTKGDFTPQKRKRNMIYKVCGVIMVAAIVLIALYSLGFKSANPPLEKLHPVFWLETIALWAFGISWLTKGKAIMNDVL